MGPLGASNTEVLVFGKLHLMVSYNPRPSALKRRWLEGESSVS